MTRTLTLSALCMLLTSVAHAKPYDIDTASSSVSFSGEHAGQPFEGRFADWTATIDFDTEKPETSSITASFELKSAATGNKMYDGTLPQADWFDVANHPTATFTSKSISASESGAYTADGELTIRGITQPAQFIFTLSDPVQQPVTAQGELAIDRLLFDIGKKSDGNAEWVSKDIKVTLSITATEAK